MGGDGRTHPHLKGRHMTETTIRTAEVQDEASWRNLWAQYIKFYRGAVPEEATANTWSSQPICYLQDLFVDPAARGGGAAKALILACEERAKEKGAFRLYWQTQEYKGAARFLYDSITPRSSFIVYRKNV
jgi:GNAT superfamily N-acetyltransferase